MIKNILLFIFIIFIFGCGSHRSTIEDQAGFKSSFFNGESCKSCFILNFNETNINMFEKNTLKALSIKLIDSDFTIKESKKYKIEEFFFKNEYIYEVYVEPSEGFFDLYIGTNIIRFSL